MSIVLISDGKLGAVISLLDDIHLEVLSLKFFCEDLFLSIEVISFDGECLWLVAHDRNCVLRIVGNDNTDNILTGRDIRSGCKVLEKTAILLEFLEALDVGRGVILNSRLKQIGPGEGSQVRSINRASSFSLEVVLLI